MKSLVFLLTSAALLAQQKDVIFTQALPVMGGPTNVAVIGGEMIGGHTVTGAPYSAEAVTETAQTLPDGNRIVNKSTTKIYRDSAGRERREQPLPQAIAANGVVSSSASGPFAIMISDPVAKVNYSLLTNQKTAMKMSASGPMTTLSVTGGVGGVAMAAPAMFSAGIISSDMPVPGPQYAARGESSVRPAQKAEDLGRQLIQGVQADGTRTTITIPAGQIGNERPIDVVSERWYSADLQVVVMSKRTDPRMGETTYQLTNISRVEPAQSLFEVPPDYQVNEPSFTPSKMVRPFPDRSNKDE